MAMETDYQFDRFFELPMDKWDLFESVNLRRSKIILANDLNPVIDFFNANEVGVGARDAEQAAAELKLEKADKERLQALLRLRSYDVYTLRAALGGHLPPDQFERLILPETERRLLEEYTRDYTRALFALIFEDTGIHASDRKSIRDALEGSTRDIVQRNVMALAKKFSIQPEELVNYIAGLGEMLLAIAFYRRIFEGMKEPMKRFLMDIKALNEDKILAYRHIDLGRRTMTMMSYGAQTMKALDQYFNSFNDIGKIWENITPERFREVRSGIERQYPLIGSILCIWQVKIADWDLRFRDRHGRVKDSSTDQRATFFTERVIPNFERIETYLNSLNDLSRVLPQARRA
ncbi:MAG: hypothetical protein ACOVVK_17440 [Elsteraceae bacterium]